MKVSWLKNSKDKKSFVVAKNMGLDVFEVEDLEKVDNSINELVNMEYSTIIISNELAGFSQDVIKKYKNSQDINIIITPGKRNTL